jgi:hypothetical protein
MTNDRAKADAMTTRRTAVRHGGRAKDRRMAQGALPAALALLAFGCGEDFAVVPVRNLERPSDLGFACVRVIETAQGSQVSGRPMVECHDPDVDDPGRVDLANRTEGTFGLATNTARGELAAIDFDLAEYRISPLLDLDLRNPGYNQLPVGSLPEVISISDDSCRAVTANRGSCDLSLVDISRLMASQFPVKTASTGDGRVVTHVRFETATKGTLRASPYEVAFLPTGVAPGTTEEAKTRPAPACQAGGVLGANGTTPWRALVTFPSCDLLALVELPSGKILSSVRILENGVVQDTGADPDCPGGCPGLGGAVPAPTDPTGPLGVGALALMREEGAMPGDVRDRVYVGAARSPVITALDVAPDQIKIPIPPDDGRVPLGENPGGVTRLRLSMNPYGPSQTIQGGRFVGMRGKFLYAFARDGSVRVVDLNRTPGGRERECDVNVEPDLAGEGPCVPLSEDSRRTRRLLAAGPGVRIPVSEEPEVAPPVPVDIAFTQLNTSAGSFATGFMLASNGQIYQLTLEGYASAGREPSTPGHSFRRTPAGQGSAAGNFAQVVGEPDRQFTPNRVPFPARVGFNSRLEGPRLESFSATQVATPSWVAFPRPHAAVPEDFWVTWEADLPGTQRTSARLETGPAGTGSLYDPGADFCRSGVLPGDIVALSGCDQDADCDQDRRGLQVCHRASPGAQGVCLPRGYVADEERLRVCRPELSSRRRYEVRSVFRGRLDFGLKLDEVPLPRQYPCQGLNDVVCQPDPAHERGLLPGDQGFQCLTRAGDTPRCLKVCGTKAPDGSWQLNDRLCRAGHVCADLGDADLGPLCVEAPSPRADCALPVAAYRVQVGQGYLVSSSALPFLGSQLQEPSTDPWGGRCVPDPNRNPLFGQRIPLSAPRCQNVLDGTATDIAARTSPSAEGGWGNPCLFRGPSADAGGGAEHVKALFENPHVRFVLTNLEQYVGDGTALRVTIEGGFSPLRVRPSGESVRFGLGVRILTSPIDSAATLSDSTTATPPPYLFVVDQGRTTTTLSRGQILRINPRPANLFPGGFIDGAGTNSLFPVQ